MTRLPRYHDPAAFLDDLFAEAERVQRRADAALGREPAARPEPPREPPELPREPPKPAPARREPSAPRSELGDVLAAAVDAARGVRGADAALVRVFDGGARDTRGLAPEEAEAYAVGPPPVGPRVRALAIGYEPLAVTPAGQLPITTGLAVPILAEGEAAGFLSIYARSPDVVFDEDQGWELLAIAATVQEALEQRATERAEAAEPVSRAAPMFRTILLVLSAAACVAAPATMAAGIHSPIRVAAALVLLALAPGVAIAPLFGGRSAPLELGLVAGTSLGVSALVAEMTLWAGAWSPWWATAVLAAVSFASILPQLGARWHAAREALA